jgi:hypothetical protein
MKIVAIAAAVVALFVSLCGYGIYWDHKHPCVKWGDATCGGEMYCSMYITDGNGMMTCALWDTADTYPCQICVGRKP